MDILRLSMNSKPKIFKEGPPNARYNNQSNPLGTVPGRYLRTRTGCHDGRCQRIRQWRTGIKPLLTTVKSTDLILRERCPFSPRMTWKKPGNYAGPGSNCATIFSNPVEKVRCLLGKMRLQKKRPTLIVVLSIPSSEGSLTLDPGCGVTWDPFYF